MRDKLPILLLLVTALHAQSDALARGLQAFSAGRFGEAELHLRQAVGADPRSFEARLALGAALAELRRPEEAIAQLTEAHRLRPGHPDAFKLLATQLMAARQYAKAVTLLSSSANFDEETTLLLIESHQASGDSANSFALAQKAAIRFPNSAPVKCWLGFQLQFAGRYDEARRYLEESLRLAPDYPATYTILAGVLLKQGKPRDAIPHFQKAIAVAPDDADAHIGLSRAVDETGDLAQALDTLRKGIAAIPREARLHLQLSRLCFRMGDEACAEKEADISLRLREPNTTGGELPSALRTSND